MSNPILAWHFTAGRKLRDGTPLRAGKVYRIDGEIKPCERGLHASTRLIDALRYAPGERLSRVEMRGEVIEHGDPADKIVGRERKVLWSIDATRILHEFACYCAEGALRGEKRAGRAVDPRSTSAIRAKRDWLAGRIDDAQLASARAAARDAAWAAARDAAWAAAWVAAGAAARDAARGAARDAAWAAAMDAARDAAWAAAMDAARDAAWAAAMDAARDRYNRKLTQMVMRAHTKARRSGDR